MAYITKWAIGLEIRKERKRQLFTQTGFAEICGFTQMELSLYEQGKRTPSIERIELMAEKLGKEWKLI